jgi:uncharacterized membrane protein YoaK (UPF0700 family)
MIRQHPFDLPSKGYPPERQPFRAQIRKYLTSSIREDVVLEAELLLLAFATGIQDATTFPDYHCFASNQTGNTVLLAVGITGIGGNVFGLSNIGVSLAMFILGSWLMGQIGNFFGCRRRWWLLTSSAVQTALVFVACGLQYRHGVADADATALGVIALLAFSSGGQVAMAKSLQITEITTAMATAAYVDIFIDQRMFEWANRSRNRRVLFLLSLLLGSFAGAFVYSRSSSPFALLISATGKLVVTLALCFNKDIVEEELKDKGMFEGHCV